MWWLPLQHWLAYMTGSLNSSGTPPNYNFWSGAGSDLGELTLVGGMLAIYRKHNCRTKWCFRFGHHDFTDAATGLTWKLCRKCHPAHPGHHLTRHHIALIHQRNQGDHHEQDD